MPRALLFSVLLACAAAAASAQEQPDPRTLIPPATLNAIAQHSSGAQVRKHVLEMSSPALSGSYAMEMRNSADGQRSMLDIRNALAAEFGPLPLDDVTRLFRDLERAGSYSIASK